MDRLTPEQRSRNMSRVRGKDTKPELAVRRALFAAGFRFRLHRKDLPGKPDLVLPRFRIAVFVHGCFWHGHSCSRGGLPTSNTEFWREKIHRNIARDEIAISELAKAGWRVEVIWECRLQGDIDDLVQLLQRRTGTGAAGSIVSTR